MRKIAFVGTSCTGKTSLLEYLRLKISSNKTVFVEESARIFFQKHPRIRKRFFCRTQGMIQDLVFQTEKEAHLKDGHTMLCDRSVIDPVAYVLASGDKKGAEKLFRKVSRWLGTYDKFFLLDPEDVDFCQDAVRQEGEEERQKLHEAFIKLFQEKGLKFELLSGTLEERAKKVKQFLKSKR